MGRPRLVKVRYGVEFDCHWFVDNCSSSWLVKRVLDYREDETSFDSLLEKYEMVVCVCLCNSVGVE